MALVKKDDELSLSSGKQVGRRGKQLQAQSVLDEDAYVQSLDKIIQRDFFPELPKLRAKEEYLDAMDHNDVERMREISARFQSSQTPGGQLCTPANFDTPSSVRDSPLPNDTSSRNTNKPNSQDAGQECRVENKQDDSNLTLDKFLAKNTSEDNESFEQIMERTRVAHKEKYDWLYKEEVERKASTAKSLSLPEGTDGDQFKEEHRPGMVQMWNYTNKNALMYVPEGVEESANEKIEGKNKRQQEVIHLNTRFTQNPHPETMCTEQLAVASAAHNAALQGKIGVDGHLQQPVGTPKVNNFGFVGTPSPAPGVDASPLMTWGSIEGTPFRLDGEDTPLNATPGPSFKMPEPKKRDKLGHALAEKVSRKHREKRREAVAKATALIGKSPKAGGRSVERLSQLSSAAQRLASSKLGIRSSTDKSLRASYSPSPWRQGSDVGTPRHGGEPGTPGQVEGQNATPSRTISLTDNLLNFPAR